MHIQEAKTQIKNAILSYSTKDTHGKYKIPVEKQRPVFLVGAPGIGKTAIVEQIARELNIGFVSYAMTHHTRQSALGLPFIIEKQYGEQTYSVSEYTMSEIIASIYEEMEKSGKKEGILFLDEINCVSETLAPSMLQFLQYKTFGRHRVPEGWIIVTAGNPAGYNDAVREFDIAMLDRLKKIEVEPDYEVWKKFAVSANVHSVVLSYLDIKPQYFYRVTTTIDGKSFVTARAWDDLSQMIALFEENNLTVDYNLIAQYIQDEEIAKDFTNYYDLYHKYRSDYQIDQILSGNTPASIVERAVNAKFDERLSLISLLLSSIDDKLIKTMLKEDSLRVVINQIKPMKDYEKEIGEIILFYKQKTEQTDTKAHIERSYAVLDIYEDLQSLIQLKGNEYAVIKEDLSKRLHALKQEVEEDKKMLENVFVFFEKSFGKGQEILILVSEMTIRNAISRFIFNHGCEKYQEYNSQLLFKDKQNSLQERIDALNMLEI